MQTRRPSRPQLSNVPVHLNLTLRTPLRHNFYTPTLYHQRRLLPQDLAREQNFLQ